MPPGGNEKRRTEFSDVISKFLMYIRSAEQTNVGDRIRNLNREYEIIQVEYFPAFGKAAELERHWSEVLKSMQQKRASFEEDFEQILAMDGIRKMEVDGDNLLVYTHPLTLDPYYGASFGVPNDIGQYTIKLDYGGEAPFKKRIVKFKHGPYKGTHYHPNVNLSESGESCFGNSQDIGLNNTIGKLVGDFQLVPMIHLILAFLERDTTAMSTQHVRDILKDPSGETDRRGYASYEARESEKIKFVSFCVRMMAKVNSIGTDKKLMEARVKRDALRNKLVSKRAEIKAAAELFNTLLNASDEMLKEVAAREAEFFSENPDVINISASGKNIMISFIFDRMEVVLELAHNEAPRIRADESVLQNFSKILTANGYTLLNAKKLEILAYLEANNRLKDIFRIMLGELRRNSDYGSREREVEGEKKYWQAD